MSRHVLTAIAVALPLSGLIAACSSKPPGCADAETMQTAKALVADNTVKYLGDKFGDDPDGWIPKFMDSLKVEITGVVNEGYNSERKKQSCKGTLKIAMTTGTAIERAIEYSTQRTEDQKGAFLLEIQDFAPFVTSTGIEARKYYDDHRWAGTWNGNYSCGGMNGATEGPQGPYSMPVSMVVDGTKAKLERTTRGGGIEIMEGGFATLGIGEQFELRGTGQNSPDDRWRVGFVGKVQGKRVVAEGAIQPDGMSSRAGRQCQLDLVLGAQTPAQVVTSATTKSVATSTGLSGTYRGQGEGTVTAEIGAATAGGGYPVRLSTTAQSAGGTACGGSVEGLASGPVTGMKFLAEREGLHCEAALKFAGGKLLVEEGSGCGNFHGAACGFSGTLDRVK